MKIGAAEETRDLGLWRTSDPPTSREAAQRVAPCLTALEQQVLDMIRARPGITPKQLDRLPEFTGKYGFSTVRRRASTLLQRGLVKNVGTFDGSMMLEATK